MATIPNSQKILTSSADVDTTYGGPASLKEMNTWYTVQDVIDTVRPYKVFTALLTQGGDDNSNVFVSSGLLTIGVTYTIDEIISGNPDWTNVGAPNNEVGTKFIATGTTPNSWGEEATLYYSAAVPVATVLENTIGNVWFTYSGVGNYVINSDALFTDNKSQVYIPNSGALNGDILFIVTAPNNQNQTDIITYDSPTSQADNVLYQTPIEIRVYE